MDPIKANSNQSGAPPASIDPAQCEPGSSSLALGGVNPAPLSEPSLELAVRSLLEAYSRPPLAVSVPLAGATEPGARNVASPRTDNNAARTSQSTAPGAYAQAGYTSSGDGVFAGVAALKQHDANSGVDVEVFSASGQFGAQTELQAGLGRIGGSFGSDTLHVAVSAEVLTARLNGGIHNDDDSHGANLGVGLTGAGVEVTLSHSGWSGTVGLAVSPGVAASSGERNIDGDEVPEYCIKGSAGPLTLGVCAEL